MKFDLHLFLTKFTSRKFFFTLIWTFVAIFLLIRDGDAPYILPVSIGALILTALYLFGEVILDRSIKINKGDINLEISNIKK
jgi:hypothetical protein